MFENIEQERLKRLGLNPGLGHNGTYSALVARIHWWAGLVIEPDLALLLQLIFVLAISLLVAFVSARAFLRSGLMNVLLLGVALLISGISLTISAWTMTPGVQPSFTENEAVTLGNLGILLASVLQFLGAVTTIGGAAPVEPGRRSGILSATVILTLTAVMLVAISADFDLFPVFLTGGGPTVYRVEVPHRIGIVHLHELPHVLVEIQTDQVRYDILVHIGFGIVRDLFESARCLRSISVR